MYIYKQKFILFAYTSCPVGNFGYLLLLGKIDKAFFNLNDNDDLDTYYLKVRAYDEENNIASWSNEVPVSFVNPQDYTGPVRTNQSSVSSLK